MGGAHGKGSGAGLLGDSQLCIFLLRGLTEGSLVWKITPQIKHSPRTTKTISNSVWHIMSGGHISAMDYTEHEPSFSISWKEKGL